MKRIFLASAVVLSLVAVTFNSCKKIEPDTESQSALDNNICETEFTKSMSTVNGFAIKENGIKSMLDYSRSSGPVITVDPADTLDGFPVTMTIDYGTVGMVDSIDHKIRKGIITCVFSNYWHIVGANVKVTLSNFYVNDMNITCDSMKITHSGTAAFTHQVFKGKCINSSWAHDLEWEATRTFTQTAGTGDLNPYNDVFSLVGDANGVTREGKSYTVHISSPIIKRTSCSWIEQGRLDLTPEGLGVRSVDFGNGNCDNQASLIINGNTFTFTMN